MAENIEPLVRLMPPHPGAGDIIDWGLMERSWGGRFPADYKSFMECYGAGAVSDYLSLLAPEPRIGTGVESTLSAMEMESLNALDYWKTIASEEGGRDRVICWGLDASADILCWRITQEDPDAWPVVVWNQDDARWRQYNCGIVEFLGRIFMAEFDECPLGGLELWGNAAPVFLHHAEEERLRSSGLDPWTGEPDPYAGMFGD
ncbi:SMI1/KNR4 family protein [Streptomyces drozdowiczii]